MTTSGSPAAGSEVFRPDLQDVHGRGRVALHLMSGRPVRRALDWGCGEGALARGLAQSGVDVVACDVDPAYVERLGADPEPGLSAVLIDDLAPSLSGESGGSFDVVTCLDVLEHMGGESRAAALAEMHRVLRSGGRLVVTVPHRGLFHWADPENLKFRLPRVHRLVYRFVRGADAYRAVYGDAARFGNYSADSEWHHHFTRAELIETLAPWFAPERAVQFGVFHPLVRLVMLAHETAARALGRPEWPRLHRAMWSVYFWDADLEVRRGAYYLGMSFAPRSDLD